jgi:hypothetical protein
MRTGIPEALLAVLLSAAPVTSLAAQSPEQLRVGLQQPKPATAPIALDLGLAESKSHWREGLVTGAVLGFLLGAALASYDGYDASIARRLGLGLVGGAVLSMPGALIGGLFPKQ